MIAQLRGIINDLKPTETVMDLGGVGYQVFIPFSTYEKLQNKKEAFLYIYTLHREDQLKIFGFYNEHDKHVFSLLLNVSGIGPSIALSILSGISSEMLVEAVKTDNISILTKIPGIGKAKAEKLIFDLKRKFKNLTINSSERGLISSTKNDAVDALASLGFDEMKSLKIVDTLLKDKPEMGIEELVKKALKIVSS